MVVNGKDQICQHCKYYDVETGCCLKDEDWPVMVEMFATCDDWMPEEEI